MNTMRFSDFCRRWAPGAARTVLLWLACLLAPVLAQVPPGAAPPEEKQVLLLLQPGYGRPGVDAYVSSFIAAWRKLGQPTEKVYVEYLDLARNPDPAYRMLSRELLLHKYRGRSLDLIVTFQQTPLNFLLEDLQALSPGAPVIASNASITSEQASRSGRRFLRQDVSFDYVGTLDVALRLFPETRRVLVLGGTGVPDLAARREIEALASRWQGRLQFDYTNDLAYDEILQRLATLQRGTIVLRTTFNRDAAGRAFSSADVGVEFSRVTSVPTFYLFDTKFGIESSVGGMMYAIGAEGERAARLGLDITAGRLRLETGVTALPGQSVPMFDWAQLKRWGADTAALPPGSTVINRPPSLYEQHRTLVLGTVGALVVLSGMVVALALENRRRRVAERRARESEERIHRMAYYDPMTDLPNRSLLMDRLAMAMLAGQRSGDFSAVLFLDLDHFKNVNDASGHAVGDALLQQVAGRLRGLLRDEDTVARIGGDEFVILLPRVGTEVHGSSQVAQGVAEKVRLALQQPVELAHQVYASGVSIGVTLLTPQTRSVDDLLREADTAMYRAKASGRNAIAFYEPAMHAEVQERLALERDLKRGIGAGELALYLQTQVDSEGRACGVELLLRWNHPVRGFVSPALFIPLAEATGLILELGRWVLLEGCRTLCALRQAGHDISVSINISPRQLREPDFPDQVRRALADTGAPAGQLIFELTEGHLVEDTEKMLARMQEVAALGIRFSIDDFGTGYSSLAYLNRMPLYELKIDQSFVQGLPADAHARGIVDTVLSIARHFSLHVVAEGVETREQADHLIRGACPSLQGYLYARPVPLAAWLARQTA